MKIKYLLVLIVLLSITFVGCGTRQNMPTEEQSVRYTADDARPWTFWYWMYGAVTPEGITADLEAMKQVGLGGAYLMPIKGVDQGPEYEGQAQQLTPEFWEMVDHSMKEAKRLGLRLGMHICDGFALAGGLHLRSPCRRLSGVIPSFVAAILNVCLFLNSKVMRGIVRI